MPEWGSYSLQDFLMFAPRVYWRLVEQYLHDTWPAALLAQTGAVFALMLAMRTSERASRVLMLLLAVAWAWVGWAFLWHRYAQINWGARYLAAAFALQAAALLALALSPGRRRAQLQERMRWLGGTLALVAVLAWPFAGLAFGRTWQQAELAGMAADPTALASLGLLPSLCLSRGRRAALCIIPLLTLVLGAATHWVMAQ
jgi:peptidoglycan/LPS O-acetylase OafA/YrhL